MKTFFSSPFMAIVITASFLLSGFKGTSQIQHGGTPISLQAGFPEEPHKDQADPITLTPYHQSLRGEILAGKTPAGQPMRAGFGLQVNYHPLENGTWLKVGDSLWVWRLHIEVEKAHGLGLILEEFTLEEGARIFVLNEKTGEYTGAYTHLNNNTHQLLSVQALPGEKITIEYQEKVRAGKEKFSGSSFRITELVYLVNGLMDSSTKNLGNSEACMINVNCSEGNEWQSQKRGVARILLKNGDSWFWCSGSLLNTTRQDGTPYFLTADHCGGGASHQDMRLWQFYFNFERPGCDNSGQPVNNVLYGCSLLVNSPLDGGSDFKLLMLNQHPPLAWQPYYNGWNILDIPSESGVGIHHPAGDAKKISTYQGAVYSGSASFSNGEEMADDAAWRFAYVATENGHSVTQGGSSGSAMFNQDGLIVGTLSGGSSSCDNPTGINVYGKMSYHWDLGDERILQVKDYLDPNQTGIHALQGYDPHTEAHPAPGFVSATLLQDEDKVRIDWLKPGHTPNKEGWYQHTTQFTGARKDVPERVTVF
ncbi:MAG: trypsin-like serine peptidase, partial [Bacteroidota bacterium]